MKYFLNICPYRVTPPITGGHKAIYYPNEVLSNTYEVCIFSMGMRRGDVPIPLRPSQFKINDHFIEYCYLTAGSALATFYSSMKTGIPPINLSNVLKRQKPKFLLQKLSRADIVQVEFPWQVEWVYGELKGRVPIVLVEHNIEYAVLERKSKNLVVKKLISKVKKQEEAAVHMADAVVCFTNEDKATLVDSFKVRKDKVRVIPCGVDPSFLQLPSRSEKKQFKKQFGLENKIVVLFIGHLWSSNIEAVRSLEKIAEMVTDPKILFLVLGRVGERFRSRKNIHYTGFVKDAIPYFIASDIAINPMTSGTGMNLKILEFLGCGLPTISTPIGARGLLDHSPQAFLTAEVHEFPNLIRLLIDDKSLSESLSINGRELVKSQYSWVSIAKQRESLYQDLINTS